MPWSTELRMMWVSGSPRRSMIERSTSVVSPDISSRTFLRRLGRELAHQPRHALEDRADRLRAHRHDAVLQLARVVDDLIEDLRQPAARCFRKILNDLPQHRLGDHQFAHHVDDAIDSFELDPGRGRGRFGRRGPGRAGGSLGRDARWRGRLSFLVHRHACIDERQAPQQRGHPRPSGRPWHRFRRRRRKRGPDQLRRFRSRNRRSRTRKLLRPAPASTWSCSVPVHPI